MDIVRKYHYEKYCGCTFGCNMDIIWIYQSYGNIILDMILAIDTNTEIGNRY